MSPARSPDEDTIRRRVAKLFDRYGLAEDPPAVGRIARHARHVLDANDDLHLTAITDLDAFVVRHVGESLEGAAMLDAATDGALLDLGSGNGYPGLPIVAVRPGLRPHLAEASRKKAAFLRSVVEADYPEGVVIDRQVQRGNDLPPDVRFAVIVSRAMGNWERVLPRLAARATPDARVLVWAGAGMEQVIGRSRWSRYRLVERRAIAGRDRSWIWSFQINK